MNCAAEIDRIPERTRRPLAAGRRRPHQGHASSSASRVLAGARARPRVGRGCAIWSGRWRSTSALVLPVLSVALPRWQLPIVTLTSDAAPPAAEAMTSASVTAR